MSKIQDALAKVRKSVASTPSTGTTKTAGQVPGRAQIANADHTDTFRALEGYGQLLPIVEEIAEANRIISSPRYAQAMASYKILRTRVLQRMRSNKWNRLAVTSCGPAEGKTVTSINLAISLARQETQNVILADLDLIHPTVCKYLGIEPRVGLAEYFSGEASLEDVLISPGIDRLLVLASANPIENSSETLRSHKMLELLERVAAKKTSSIIIFDMPPLLRSDDVLAFGPLVDALLLVVSTGKSSRVELERAKELLQEFNHIGTALNMSTESAAAYY